MDELPPTEEPAPARRRSWLRPGHALAFVVFAAAGVLFAASAVTAAGTDLRGDRGGELRDLVRRQADAVAGTESVVGDLQREVDAAVAAAAGSEVGRARARADAVAAQAGRTPMTGPGLSVTLQDAPRPAPGTTIPGNPSPDDLVVHQQDVQAVVNALWRGGAQGIQVMDQRLVSTSAVRCVGNTLILQGRVYSPPFVITGVGDVAGMQRSLDVDPQVLTYRDYVTLFGLGYEVRDRGTVTLPGFTGSILRTG